jgi:hypothetical protein
MNVITYPPRARLLEAVCRNDFASFLQKCYHTLSPAATFHPNWHILAVAHHLEQVRLGKNKRLIINMPPRSLKSVMSSVAFPASIMGHDATKRVIAVSYGSELAIKQESAGFQRRIVEAATQDVDYIILALVT